MLYESHCHTPLCNHAEGEPTEYAAAALAAGLKGIIVTCHCPLPDGHSDWVRMRPTEYELYHQMIAAARQEYAGRLDVRAGIESDYYPGVESWLEELHARHPLSHVLGSVHPQLPEYRDRYYNGDDFAFQQTYFDHVAQAAETGLFDTMAHPDLVKNMTPDAWDFERIAPYIGQALDRIAATGVAMELNTSGRYKTIPEMNPSPSMLAMMLERNIPVVIGADAHVPHRVGEGYPEALRTLQQVGFTEVNIFLDRQRTPIPIADALASLTSPSSPQE
jgi:histidinol-phosphatase (PHP family)